MEDSKRKPLRVPKQVLPHYSSLFSTEKQLQTFKNSETKMHKATTSHKGLFQIA
jgi:hypothetical protein